MIDVTRNYRSSSRHFASYEVRGYFARDVCAERFATVLLEERVAVMLSQRRADILSAVRLRAGSPRSIFSNRDEFHLSSDDSLARVPKLSHGMGFRAQNFSAREVWVFEIEAWRFPGIWSL
jgi:hypothetical protein